MEHDAVQRQNKPLECRFILLGALISASLYRQSLRARSALRFEIGSSGTLFRRESVAGPGARPTRYSTGWAFADGLTIVSGTEHRRPGVQRRAERDLVQSLDDDVEAFPARQASQHPGYHEVERVTTTHAPDVQAVHVLSLGSAGET